MLASKIAYALLFLQNAPMFNAAESAAGQLPVDQAVRQDLNNAVASASALKPPYHYEPGAVDIGRLTKEEWASVQGDLFRYEGALERWRIANGSGGTIEPQQGPQLQESVQTWIDASSKEWRRFAQIFYCIDGVHTHNMAWGWGCLEGSIAEAIMGRLVAARHRQRVYACVLRESMAKK
ncbi:unnamed protein product, partial [Mesorhabditis spiculigera]